MSLYFVFDVESVGLHGEGFAVGYVVVDAADRGRELDSGLFVANMDDSPGLPADRDWVKANVSTALDVHVSKRRSLPAGTASVHKVREAFWDSWAYWSGQKAVMAADVPWPVESRFLNACIADDPARKASGPYPLIDVASVRLAAGLDPLATCDRLDDEKPAHNPLADARQSARLLLEALAT